MKEGKLILLIISLSVIVLFGGVLFVSKNTANAQLNQSENAKAEVESQSFDWGQIPFSGGNVSKTFTIKNAGTDTLKIGNIRTSCHCTKAIVKINSNSSPYFGMNTVSSWTGEIPPGKSAELKVIFDPAYHGTAGIGPISRLVDVETNDPRNPKIEFSLSGTVIK